MWLPPPQLYELSRLCGETDIDKILSFAKQRCLNAPTTLFFPIQYHVADGLISCYPGDDFYPKNPNYATTEHDVEQYADKTCEECRKMSKNLHRLELKSPTDVQIWCTNQLADQHLKPYLPSKL